MCLRIMESLESWVQHLSLPSFVDEQAEFETAIWHEPVDL